MNSVRRNKPQGSAELLVVHRRLVLALAPFLRHQLRLVELELALLTHPGDAVSRVFVRQQLQQKLPQLDLTVVTWATSSSSSSSHRGNNVNRWMQ